MITVNDILNDGELPHVPPGCMPRIDSPCSSQWVGSGSVKVTPIGRQLLLGLRQVCGERDRGLKPCISGGEPVTLGAPRHSRVRIRMERAILGSEEPNQRQPWTAQSSSSATPSSSPRSPVCGRASQGSSSSRGDNHARARAVKQERAVADALQKAAYDTKRRHQEDSDHLRHLCTAIAEDSTNLQTLADDILKPFEHRRLRKVQERHERLRAEWWQEAQRTPDIDSSHVRQRTAHCNTDILGSQAALMRDFSTLLQKDKLDGLALGMAR